MDYKISTMYQFSYVDPTYGQYCDTLNFDGNQPIPSEQLDALAMDRVNTWIARQKDLSALPPPTPEETIAALEQDKVDLQAAIEQKNLDIAITDRKTLEDAVRKTLESLGATAISFTTTDDQKTVDVYFNAKDVIKLDTFEGWNTGVTQETPKESMQYLIEFTKI